jgi:hypothetical protein
MEILFIHKILSKANLTNKPYLHAINEESS